MKPYRTLATVRLFSGLIGLTDGQAKRRSSYLSKIKDDVYKILGEVSFKAGEVIGLEDAPKPYRKLMQSLEPAKPAIQAEVKETVKVAATPAAKKRTYKKRKA